VRFLRLQTLSDINKQFRNVIKSDCTQMIEVSAEVAFIIKIELTRFIDMKSLLSVVGVITVLFTGGGRLPSTTKVDTRSGA